MPDIKVVQRDRLIEQAKRYAKADRSDPFALNRAIAHIRCGIARGEDNYNAEEYAVTRHLPEGVFFSDGETNTFPVTDYKNVHRP